MSLGLPVGAILGGLLASCFSVFPQSAADYAVRLTASVQTNPAQITLSWPADPNATSFTVSRKSRDATSWTGSTTLPGTATNYTHAGVSVGSAYEYRVVKSATVGSASYTGYGYIYAGIQAPLVESRGKIVLVVDDLFSASLEREIDRLQQDLVGDGWTVLRSDVSRTGSVSAVKSIIRSAYNADPSTVKAVFLLGHVPVPYSGDLNPDGHADHKGAWPADVYYGEMNGTWTDTTVDNSTASSPRNRNVPGDGKFDQNYIPSTVELQVGRVDFANLPAFAQSEGELLRQYLEKDHWFRHKGWAAAERALIDDHFGAFSGEAFAANGWRAFAPLVGATNTSAGDYLSTLGTRSQVQPYLWLYGCGGGTYTSAGGVVSTSDLVSNDTRVVFTMLFGSYFGDWDSPNNLLRAQLATTSYTLSSVWAGRPYWLFHHLGLGEPIGFGARVTQNNLNVYYGNYGTNLVHIALLGDPTLRMRPVAPPTALTIAQSGPSSVTLAWNASADEVAGYHVYRATSLAGPFTRRTTSLATGTSWTDSVVSSNVYMVRAVKLQETPSGSYFNASQGVFQSLDESVASPSVLLVQPATDVTNVWPGQVRLSATTFDPAGLVTNVAFFADELKLGELASGPYVVSWTNPPLGIYTVVAQAQCGNGLIVGSPAVRLVVDNGGRPRITIENIGPGTNVIRGTEVLGRSYRIQRLDLFEETNWSTLGLSISNSATSFSYEDTNATGSSLWYRTVFP